MMQKARYCRAFLLSTCDHFLTDVISRIMLFVKQHFCLTLAICGQKSGVLNIW